MQKLLMLCCLVPPLAVAPKVAFPRAPRRANTYPLRPQRSPGSVDRVVAALEVAGENKVVQENKLQRFKMSVLANVTYDERVLEFSPGSDGPMRSIRHYDKAAVQLRLEEDEVQPALRDGRRLVAVQINGPSVILFSPQGPLTRDELDLLEMHGTSVSLLGYRLLPDEPVAIGDSWKHSAELMAALLDLDAVSQTDVASVLREASDGMAEIEMSGRVEGAVGGVSTQIELKAKYHFDLSAGRLTWFGMVARENRSVGHVGPGLEALSRLQMKFTPLEESTVLSDSALSGLTLRPSPELTRLSYESPEGGWRFVHDRKWFITQDEDRLAVLRLIDRGEFVAQCKIHTLPDAAPEEQVTLAEFQDDIRHGLGEHFKQFVQASQRSNALDYRVYRAVAAGEVEQLPIHWIYYLVANEHGRQVVFAFTVEGKLLEQFGEADQELLGALKLDAPKVAAKPTPAEP